MIETSEKFEGWGIVEMLGHRKLAGKVSEQVIAGSALVRVDVPETQQSKTVPGYGGTVIETTRPYTKLIGVGSIYCITPCDEETARRAAAVIERYNDPLPVTLPKLIVAGAPIAEGPPAEDVIDVDFERAGDDEEDDDRGPFNSGGRD